MKSHCAWGVAGDAGMTTMGEASASVMPDVQCAMQSIEILETSIATRTVCITVPLALGWRKARKAHC